MKTIPLTRGKVAIVDDVDFAYLSQWKWCFNENGYAMRRRRNSELGDTRCIYMHRLIARASEDESVDHRNLDKLDNSRANLRIADSFQNSANKRCRKDSRSGVKGVQSLKNGTFRVRVKSQGHLKFDKCFPTVEEAKFARDEVSASVHGEFSRS